MRTFLLLLWLVITGCSVTLFDPSVEYVCDDEADCTDGWTCFAELDGRKTCVQATEVNARLAGRDTARTEIVCSTDSDCPTRLECRPQLGYSLDCDADTALCVCVGSEAWEEMLDERLTTATSVACEVDENCGPRMVCQADDAGSLRCIGSTAAAQELEEREEMLKGQPCVSNSDCGGLVCQADNQAQKRCLTPEDAAAEREARAECPPCAAGESCHTELLDGEMVGFCRSPCNPFSSDPVCEDWEVCDVFQLTPGHGICSLPCDDDNDCSGGRTCDVETGTCGCTTDLQCNTPVFVCDGVVGRCTPACQGDSDCLCGSVCAAGLCSAGCNSDADCCNNSMCEEGRCTVETPVSGNFGEACSRDYHCAGTLTCPYTTGFCTEPSSVATCTATEGCSGAARCARYVDPYENAAQRACLPTCNNDDDCAPRAHCRTTPPTGGRVCIRRCAEDADCLDGQCDTASGRCVCAGDDDCKEAWGEGATCAAGECSCTPDCAGKVCGDDGCGGTCGECALGLVCNDAQTQCETRAEFCDGPEPDVECEQDRGYWCPANSTCRIENGEAVACTCNTGFTSQTCGGVSCADTTCVYPNWTCVAE